MQTVLVIEDNEDNMKLITFILEKNGYQTITAETGAQGIQMVISEKPDLILLDIQLPDMNGLDVLKAIRNSESNGGIPIIAVTSFAMSGDRERLLDAGCNGYIEKPINPETFIFEIRQVTGDIL
ncbi:MAG: response regulator [Desulfobacteraceae bacterium]|nr:response regulator [Desulfobacteraceae bacterium]